MKIWNKKFQKFLCLNFDKVWNNLFRKLHFLLVDTTFSLELFVPRFGTNCSEKTIKTEQKVPINIYNI